MECIGNEFVRLGKRQQEMLNEICNVVKPLHKMLGEKDKVIAEKDEMIKKLVSDKEHVIQQERDKFEEERKEYLKLLSGMRVE